MTSRTGPLTLTTIAAVTGDLPRMGEQYLIFMDGRRTLASVTAASPLQADPLLVAANPHWSTLASVRFELPEEALNGQLYDSRVQRFEVRNESGDLALAAGLALSAEPSRLSSAENGLTIWLTGLSGAGKSTIAQELERRLKGHCKVECLDADVVRTHLCKGLGFTAEDRTENVRRIALAARIIAATGTMVLVSAISPYRAAREEARSKAHSFIEVYVNAPLSVCENRDVKGLYKRVRRGEIKSFTGIDDPYEPPQAPEVECRTDRETLEESVSKILSAIAHRGQLLPMRSEPGQNVCSVRGVD